MNRRVAWGFVLSAVLAAVVAVPAAAQSEASLRSEMIGRYIVVRMDMPADKAGVDIFVNKAQKLKHKENDRAVRKYGAAFENGEAAKITDIRVKKKFIEVLLEGGGYGIRGDEKKKNFWARPVAMTEEEENLREELPYLSTSQPQTKILVEYTIEHLEAERETEYQRRIERAQSQEQDQNDRVMAQRRAGGSRFQIRFGRKIPASALTPEGLMSLLDGYVDFSSSAVEDGKRQRARRD